MSSESKEVNIAIAGGHYSIRTEREDILLNAAEILENKYQESNDSSKIVNTHRAIIMAGLKVSVEYVESKETVSLVEAEIDRLNARLNEIDI